MAKQPLILNVVVNVYGVSIYYEHNLLPIQVCKSIFLKKIRNEIRCLNVNSQFLCTTDEKKREDIKFIADGRKQSENIGN